MPHAESPTQMVDSMANGNKNQSQFINHLQSYPIVHDGVKTFQDNPHGAKCIDLADATYERFGKPLTPYLQGPYSYAKPYVQKVDSMADRSLDTVDAHFPIVKEETNTVVDRAVNLAKWPFHMTGRTYNYLMDTWSSEYEKTASHNNRGPGIVTSAMAIVSTELKIASDCLQMGADMLARKDMGNSQMAQNARQGMERAAGRAQNMAGDAKAGMDHAQDMARDGMNRAQNMAGDGMNRAQNMAGDAKAEAQGQAQHYQNQAKQTAQGAKRQAKDAANKA